MNSDLLLCRSTAELLLQKRLDHGIRIPFRDTGASHAPEMSQAKSSPVGASLYEPECALRMI